MRCCSGSKKKVSSSLPSTSDESLSSQSNDIVIPPQPSPTRSSNTSNETPSQRSTPKCRSKVRRSLPSTSDGSPSSQSNEHDDACCYSSPTITRPVIKNIKRDPSQRTTKRNGSKKKLRLSSSLPSTSDESPSSQSNDIVIPPQPSPTRSSKTSNETLSRLPTKRHGSKKKVSLSLASTSEESSSSQSNEVVIHSNHHPPNHQHQMRRLYELMESSEELKAESMTMREWGIIQSPPLCPPTEWKFHPSGHQWYYTPLVRWNEKRGVTTPMAGDHYLILSDRNNDAKYYDHFKARIYANTRNRVCIIFVDVIHVIVDNRDFAFFLCLNERNISLAQVAQLFSLAQTLQRSGT